MNKHIVLSCNPIYNYTLLIRLNDEGKLLSHSPFVVAWRYDHISKTWAQGHYFETLESAMMYMQFKDKCEDVYKVISEIKNVPFDLDY